MQCSLLFDTKFFAFSEITHSDSVNEFDSLSDILKAVEPFAEVDPEVKDQSSEDQSTTTTADQSGLIGTIMAVVSVVAAVVFVSVVLMVVQRRRKAYRLEELISDNDKERQVTFQFLICLCIQHFHFVKRNGLMRTK